MRSERKNLLISLVINALFLLLVLLLFTPYYETYDDFIMSVFVDGSMGFSETRIVFVNVIVGGILKALYAMLPSLPWYALMQYALLFCAFTSVTWVLFERDNTFTALLLSLVTLCVFASDVYICVQFTKTAAVVTVSGLFLLCHCVGAGNGQRMTTAKICGIILALFGSMYRKNVFLLCGAISCFVVFEPLVRGIKNADGGFGEKSKAVLKTLSPFIVLLSLFAAAVLIDSLTYRGEAWEYYRQYNDVRRSIMDYQLPQYAPYAQEFDRLGIPESFIKIMRRWDFYDPELLDLEALKAVKEIPPEIKLIGGDTAVIDFFPVCGKVFITGWCFAGLVIFAIAWLAIGKHNCCTAASIVCAGLTALVISIYLFLSGRYNIYRVNYSIVFSLAAVVLHCIPGGTVKRRRGLTVLLALVSVFLLYKYLTYDNGVNAKMLCRGETERGEEISEAVKLLADDEHFILYDSFMPIEWFGTPLEPENMSFFEHAACIGGWQTNHPSELKMYEKYSIKNPFRDMVNNDRVYLFSHEAEDICDYIRDEYYPDAVLNPVSSVGDYYAIYTVTSENARK